MTSKPLKGKEKEAAEGYLEEFRDMLRKVDILSQVETRQLMGTRPEGDSRVEYLTALESFKNLANVQLQVLIRLAMGNKDFLAIFAEELGEQVEHMESDLCVAGWDASGNPVFDLQEYRKRTAGWPP